MAQKYNIPQEIKESIYSYIDKQCREEVAYKECDCDLDISMDQFPNLYIEVSVHCDTEHNDDWGSDPYYEISNIELIGKEIEVTSAYYCDEEGNETEIEIEL